MARRRRRPRGRLERTDYAGRAAGHADSAVARRSARPTPAAAKVTWSRSRPRSLPGSRARSSRPAETKKKSEKRLGSSLLAGHALLSIDNVSRPLGGDFLCQLLDQPLIKVRILGQSAGPLIEPRICLFATGNNLTLIGDIVRRTVVAHIDAG